MKIDSLMSRRLFLQLVGGAALAAGLPAPAAARTRSFRFADRAVSTGWLPFEFYREAQVHLSGVLGNRPARIFLDSGVSGLIIDQAYADRLGIARGKEMQANTVSSRVTGWTAPEQNLTLGNLQIRTREVAILDMSPLYTASGKEFDLMLGRDLFEQLEVDIDFPGRRMAAHDRDHFSPPGDARAVPLVPSGPLRSLPVSVEGRPAVQATFDLGSNAALIVAKGYADRERILAGKRTTTLPSGGAEGARLATAAILDQVELGGRRFSGVPVSVPERWQSAGVDANVGAGLLSRFRLITDYSRDRLYLIPGPDAQREFRRDRSGLRSIRRGDRLWVGHVSRGSPAEAAGWRGGEEIVAVNGWRIGSPDFTEERSFWSAAAAGTEIRLTLADGSERRLVLADYY